MSHRIKAAYYSRQAWIHLGKAQELRTIIRHTHEPFIRNMRKGMLQDEARMARMNMHTAVLYRQMDGVL
jgi:hypothetical protein